MYIIIYLCQKLYINLIMEYVPTTLLAIIRSSNTKNNNNNNNKLEINKIVIYAKKLLEGLAYLQVYMYFICIRKEIYVIVISNHQIYLSMIAIIVSRYAISVQQNNLKKVKKVLHIYVHDIIEHHSLSLAVANTLQRQISGQQAVLLHR